VSLFLLLLFFLPVYVEGRDGRRAEELDCQDWTNFYGISEDFGTLPPLGFLDILEEKDNFNAKRKDVVPRFCPTIGLISPTIVTR
jgi:hypothetical protein